MPIRFFREGINFQLKQKNLLRQWLMGSSQAEGFSIQSLTFVFMNDKNLLALNRQYLHHDEYTDIITFDLSEKSGRKKKEIEGEIYISIERVKENAKIFGKTFQEELHRVMIHGVLHLCGYSDKTSASQKKMRAMEDFYLKKLKDKISVA
ncbi:MAG: rRNA maturation RNase YbeY [Bacteroidia bacterium]|nr:rRNA maturation RNase YbeY [Bacteroidia bacterium]